MYQYVAITRMKEEFVYKYRVVLGILASVLSMILLWYVWSALFASSGQTVLGGFTFSAIVTYMIISTCMRAYQQSYVEYRIQSDVKTGYIGIELTRPYKYPIFHLFNIIGEAVYNILIKVIPILAVGFLFFNLSMPTNALMFFISTGMGFIINFCLMFMTGMWAFWTIGNIWGLKHSRDAISAMISGSFIPLSFFPEWLSNIANFLPFKAIYSTPLSIYVGNLVGLELYYALLHQVTWLVITISLTYFIWKKAEKKTVIQGG